MSVLGIDRLFVHNDPFSKSRCTAHIARAFCHDSFGGNPAGVIITDRAHPFPVAQMQSIAKQLNFSETVFITSTGPSSYQTLYFTPTSPIDFCGHATLAAFGVLKHFKCVEEGVYFLDTQVGKCEVTLKEQLIFLSQPLPVFGEEIGKSELTPILGDFVNELTPQIVSTALRDIFVQVQDKTSLLALQPDLTLLSALNQRTDSIGMHVFCLNPPGNKVIAQCRNFAPLHGIDEESATGSSTGALACYLFEKGMLPSSPEHQLLFRQGESLQAPSDICVRLKVCEGKIVNVECGGEVVFDQTREIFL